MPSPLIIVVGGFLGAGKTTLILYSARLLRSRGLRVAVIMNDQDRDLVDTRYSNANQLDTREVTGGCFCCRFSDLLEAADQLNAYQPDIIFAEPVGSCIDLAATVIQPLKSFSTYRVAPLTVLIDPGTSGSDPDITYLSDNQAAEADILCSTKSDLYPAHLPVDFALSAKTGHGVEAWLDEVISGSRIAGSQVLSVDYVRYAAAEAALGWLNFHADVRLDHPASPAALAGPLLDNVQHALAKEFILIAHLKLFCQAPTGFVKVSISSNQSVPQVDGDLIADPTLQHELAINLRAIADPQRLTTIVTRSLKALHGRVHIRHQSAFRPAPPKPEHRITGSGL